VPKSRWPKISIVTPSYNQGVFLERTIESVLGQNYPNLEYVIIDGGSTDQSVKIIKKYAKKLHYWQSKKDKGQSDAINTGFAHTTGEIMYWINSDDVMMPGSLRLVASIFKKNKKVNWLTALPATITVDDYINYVAQPPWYVRTFLQRGWYIQSLFGFVMQEGTFWRRSLWNKAGKKVEDVPYSMDWLLWRKFAEFDQLVVVKSLLAAYRLNPNRKNNDEHSKYYREIGVEVPQILSMLVKFCWRKVANGAHLLKIPAMVWYSEKDQTWLCRSGSGQVKTFQLLR
jgi:glycosyltransferase involved in cell wall biosynthesis